MLPHIRRSTASTSRRLLHPRRSSRATPTSSSPLVAVASTIGNNNANTTAATTIMRRAYVGGAGEMKSRRENAKQDDAIAMREQELWDRARPRYDAIMERHVRLPSMKNSGCGDGNDDDRSSSALDVRRKRLVYRSKQRGWLEVDLLLGTWASMNVHALNAEELDQFEEFVNMETIDIYNVLTLRSDVPEGMGGTLVERIQDWCMGSPLGKADKEKYDEVKTRNNLI
ncbi:hypothetical protein ACHAXA_006474 [Cyclostephanos tholiformis]|uniref:Succinate dehydrogenase assembly factor 2, mitochondrial n=1 Tax=Cyclostephanos tholiformis TaxID=382380 RepID=A0ABD3RZG5_9STRA